MVNRRRDTQGAALIIVIAIMAILTAIAVTFLSVTRQDMKTATDVNEGVKGDLIAEAAIAFAQYSLNKDLLDHPNVTSNDHAWRTIYNGLWVAGKPWALRDGIPLSDGGVPEVDLTNMPYIQFYEGGQLIYQEELYRGMRTKNWLHIPRFEGNSPVIYSQHPDIRFLYPDGTTRRLETTSFQRFDPALHPFITSDFYGSNALGLIPGNDTDNFQYPREQVALLTDVDNNNDGLPDAIWVPIPADVFFDVDGVDNDLDGIIDEANEAGTFVYHGLGNYLTDPNTNELILSGGLPVRVGDGLDNDGNGFVDDPNEDRLFLTSPLPGRRFPVDLNGDGIFDSDDYVALADGSATFVPLEVILPDTIPVLTSNPLSGALNVETVSIANVDVLDNDFDLFINDYVSYAYVPEQKINDKGEIELVISVHEYSVINLENPYPSGVAMRGSLLFNPPLNNINSSFLVRPLTSSNAILNTIVISHSGEPVCELAGRAAITITDESAKVNLNVAGGRQYDLETQTTIRTAGNGATPYEYDTRALPGVGNNIARNMWQALMGDPSNNAFEANYSFPDPFYLDAILPGYGRVDDNGNVLIAAMNGIDDDGDGLIDEGIYLPEVSDDAAALARGYYDDGTAFDEQDFDTDELELLATELYASRYEEYWEQLGILEGVDEPAELFRFNPLRNRIAEGALQIDSLDNDFDGAVNEFRELADLQFQNREHALSISGLNGTDSEMLANSVTAHSTSRNVQHLETRSGIRSLNKLDYNYATAQQIATQFMLSAEFEPLTTRSDIFTASEGMAAIAINFAEGLRTGHAHMVAPSAGAPGSIDDGGLLHVRNTADSVNDPQYAMTYFWPTDPQLRAMQVAVDLIDNRDPGNARTRLTTEIIDRIPSRAHADYDGNPLTIEVAPWPNELNPREVIPDDSILPTEEIELHADLTLDMDNKILQAEDKWWSGQGVISDQTEKDGITYTGRLEGRNISYSAAGTEAIRINELMVRPVRRVEAEATPDSLNFSSSYLLNFDPTPYSYLGSGVTAEQLFDAEGNVASVLPEFFMQRRTFNTHPVAPYNASNWLTVGDGNLGTNSGLAIGEATSDDPLEYIFVGSPGLPAGRYYLTVNVSSVGGAPGIDALLGGQLRYAIKYVPIDNLVTGTTPGLITPIGSTILDDFADDPSDVWTNAFVEVPDEWFGLGREGMPRGWVFLDGSPDDFDPLVDPFYFEPGLGNVSPDLISLGTEDTHTVFVPSVESGYALCVALMTTNAAGMSVNFFDFSQEPDHEYIELVNVSEDVVDLSRWELEVGIPDRPGAQRDPYKSVWRIPNGTEIAPGGMVLLTTNKRDNYRVGSTSSLIEKNGMGAARGDLAGLEFVTVPPFADESWRYTPAYGYSDTIQSILYDPTGSVFDRRGSFIEYIDRDGDGLTSSYVTKAMLDLENTEMTGRLLLAQHSLDTDDTITEEGTISSDDGPWDSIIELENQQLYDSTPEEYFDDSPTVSLRGVSDVNELARLVLSGGMLPNYPEHDGHDNDGDGGFLLTGKDYIDVTGDDEVDYGLSFVDQLGGVWERVHIYVPGTLDKDMVDNDLDGWIDERGEIQLAPISGGFEILTEPDPRLSEGVDEGRMDSDTYALMGRYFGAGSFEQGTLPVVFFNDRSNYPVDAGWKRAYFDTQPRVQNDYLTVLYQGYNTVDDFFDGTKAINAKLYLPDGETFTNSQRDRLVTRLGNQALNATFYNAAFITQDATYLGSRWDPPEWKAFVERRWYPGDNVVVTLYEGAASQGRIADRVTYREYDVINRTIDDVIATPYGAANALNPDYMTFWQPNHMGLDFYRALERKHPMYPGDRFGTSNRWEATDGNYDDWSESPSYFVRGTAFAGGVSVSSFPYFVDPEYVAPRFAYDSPALAMNKRLMSHAMNGSPLRMNFAHRVSSNPDDLIGTGIRLATDPYVGATATLAFFTAVPDNLKGPAPGGLIGAPEDTLPPYGQFWGDDYTQDIPPDLYVSLGAAGGEAISNLDWNHKKAVVANKPYQSHGDLMRVPQVALQLRFSPRYASPYANFLLDSSGVNQYIAAGQPIMRDLSLRGATLGQDTTDTSIPKNLLAAAVDGFAQNPVILTVGQAKFTPILPDAASLNSSMLDWDGGSPPRSWMPVFLFQRDIDIVDFDNDDSNFPNYPAHFNGDWFDEEFPIYSLFNATYLLNYPETGTGNALYPRLTEAALDDAMIPRWPLETRAMMYIAGQGTGVSGDPSVADPNRPEALFTWDADDGLENGEYLLYVGTFIPGMGQRLRDADRQARAVTGVPLLRQENDDPDAGLDPVVNAIINYDPQYNPGTTNIFAPHLALDVITDPSRANGYDASGAVGLVPPAMWTPGIEYTPRDDGYIFYGNDAAGGWQPRIIRVTDNFLALRVRNMGAPGQHAIITHVVLSPRRQSPGKINVNTAESNIMRFRRVGEATGLGRDELWNPLLGLPGVVDALTATDWGPVSVDLRNPLPHDRRITSDDDVAAPTYPPRGADPVPMAGLGAWTSPTTLTSSTINAHNAFVSASVPPTPNVRSGDTSANGSDPLADGYNVTDGFAYYEDEIAALRLSSMIMEGRVENYDGRYYSSPADLALDANRFVPSSWPIAGPPSSYDLISPLSNEVDPRRRFDEAAERLGKMGNVISVRSDVFTIQATVQPGYAVDTNGDGRVNYRSNDEFISTGERKVRVVYERRAPADRSDQAQP